MDRGTYLEIDGRPAVRFARRFPHPIERVWAAVTDPEGLRHWFPSQVSYEPRVGGEISFSGDPNADPTTGRVLVFDPPHRFCFHWSADELRFELHAEGPDACTLTLINILEAEDAAARNAAGWHVCLGELAKSLDGADGTSPHGAQAQPWRPLYEAYLADGLPSGAHIPP